VVEQQPKTTIGRHLAGAVHWAVLVVCLAILAVVLFQSRHSSNDAERIEDRIAVAGVMLNEGLPAEAVAEYEAALDLARGDRARKANLCYLIGKIYFENLKDYEKALAYFARAKHYNPNHPQRRKIEQWSVECLERLGRSLDAENKIRRATSLRPIARPASGTVVAQIGGRPITMGELDAEIRSLPPEVQRRFADPKQKLAFLEQYVARRLLADAARRAGLDHDPEVLRELDRARDDVLVGAYFDREIAAKVNVTTDELKLYYEAHKEDFREPRRFSLSHIELGDEAAATSVAAALKKGGDFGRLARKFSQNAKTREKGGAIGSWTEGSPLPPPLDDDPALRKAVAALKKGEWTAPVKTKSGKYQIVRADEISSPTLRPFDQVKRLIEARLRSEKTMKRQQEVLSRLRRAENVIIYRGVFGEKGKARSK